MGREVCDTLVLSSWEGKWGGEQESSNEPCHEKTNVLGPVVRN